MIRIGPAGKPISYKGDFIEVPKFLAENNMGVIEVEFVRGVWMDEMTAKVFDAQLKRYDIVSTIHAPYYINLLGAKETREKSRERIINCLEVGHHFHARNVVFHAGYYGELSQSGAYDEIKKEIEILLEHSRKNDVPIAPETTGKVKQFGSLEELIRLSKEFNIPFTLDFAHLHARNGGMLKSEDDYRKVLDTIEKELGAKFIRSIHIHYSGIQYGKGGELKHLPISSNEPDYNLLAIVLRDYDMSDATVISESPLIEEDAYRFMEILENKGIKIWKARK
ncbi:MAG: TIM barrel protein [Candidatus Korarchaeota archaeon]